MFYSFNPPKILDNPALDNLIRQLLAEYDYQDRHKNSPPLACSGSITFDQSNINISGIKMTINALYEKDKSGYGTIFNHNGIKCNYNEKGFKYVRTQ